MAMQTIEAYLVHSVSVNGRHWKTVFDKYGQIICTVHEGGAVHQSPLFFRNPEVAYRPKIGTDDIRGKIVFKADHEVEFLPEAPRDIDPEFESALNDALWVKLTGFSVCADSGD